MEFVSTLNVVLTVMTLVAGGGMALLLGTLKTLRDSNQDLRDRDKDRELRVNELEKNNIQLTADIEAMRRIVTGEAHLVALQERLDEHHHEAMGHWERTEGLIGRTAALVESVIKETRRTGGTS